MAIKSMTNIRDKQYYYPGLDSIRGLSFLAVFFYHSYHPVFGVGLWNELLQFLYTSLDFSIDVFFVLSSFLLTFLGIREYDKNQNFSFRNFFYRRALRIWPLYYLIMLFSFVFVPVVAGYAGYSPSLPPAGWYLFFISNFYLPDHVYFLRFLWTLSVEEQFYLFLGLTLFFFRKSLKNIVLFIIVIGLFFNFFSALYGLNAYFNTLTYLFDFACGSLAAIVFHKNGNIINKLRSFNTKKSILLFLSLIVMLLAGFLIQKNTAGAIQDLVHECIRAAFIIFISLFILEQMSNNASRIQLGKNKFLVYTGKISYGLYCFHGIVLTFGSLALKQAGILLPALGTSILFLAINYGVASLSYFLFEKPFLRLKEKFRRL